jgi:hypothetical protein
VCYGSPLFFSRQQLDDKVPYPVDMSFLHVRQKDTPGSFRGMKDGKRSVEVVMTKR